MIIISKLLKSIKMNGNGCIGFGEVLHQNIFHSYHTFLRNVKPRLAHCHGVSLMMTKVMSKTLTTSLIHGHSDPELFFPTSST